MENRRGTFIVIEGTDGSGKGTQFELLKTRLQNQGYDVATFDFPQYNKPSSYFVQQYLNGNFGTLDEVGPYTASLFYALDRYEAAPKIRQALDAGKVVISNRFTGSSMGHQGTKFRSAEERRGFFIWLDNLEFEMLRIPRPSMSFVLRVPADIAQRLVDQKGERSYTTKKRDLHEADLNHLQQSVAVYDDLTQLFPKDFQRIDCVRDGQLLPVETVQELIWQKIHPLLPELPKSQPAEAPTAPVAAVVQNSVQPETPSADAASFFRQLAGTPFMLNNASNLLAQRLAAEQQTYKQQPLHSIPYDQKDTTGNYRYYVPASLPAEIQTTYRAYIDDIFNRYAAMTHRLRTYIIETATTPQSAQDTMWHNTVRVQACDALEAVLPVAATSTVATSASGQVLEGLLARLLSDELPEARQAGEYLLAEVRKTTPSFPQPATASVASLAKTRKELEQLAAEYLPANHATETASMQLTDVWPRNELDLLPDMLYDHTSLPLAELKRTVAGWPYERKLQAFEAYVHDLNPQTGLGRSLEKVHYSWDLVCDYATLRALQGHQMAGNVECQALTPRYGYEIPKLVEEAGLADEFEACFDRSLALYSILQQAGYPLEAQYATLLGHKLRWNTTYSASQAFQLHTLYISTQIHSGCRGLVQHMYEKLTEAHPILGEAMQAVGQRQNLEPTQHAAM